MIQLKTTTLVISDIYPSTFKQNDLIIRIGAALGFLSALLSMGGIKIIKWVNIISLPFLIFYHLFSIMTSENDIILNYDLNISLPIINSIILFFLPGTINLPTFFRHSRSLADSYLALTLMAIFYTFFQISSFWLKVNESIVPDFSYYINSKILLNYFFIIFIILITISNLLVNIYFASASWEFIAKIFNQKFKGSKEYAIIGLIGTAAYTFIQISSPMKLLIDLANLFLANLGFVLIMTFLLEFVMKKRYIIFGKFIGAISWFVTCGIATILQIENPNKITYNLLISTLITIMFFLSVIFLEETTLAIREIYQKKKAGIFK
jgi:cytosine permease